MHDTHKCNNQNNNRMEHTAATQKRLIHHGSIHGQPKHSTRGSKTTQLLLTISGDHNNIRNRSIRWKKSKRGDILSIYNTNKTKTQAGGRCIAKTDLTKPRNMENMAKIANQTICNEYGVLNSPLGKWTTVTQRWEGYSHNERVYIKKEKWYKDKITKNARSTYIVAEAREVAKVPRGAVPITDVKEGNTILFTPPSSHKKQQRK
eukprot:11730248-Ditylum_brightwellii.AAC.1